MVIKSNFVFEGSEIHSWKFVFDFFIGVFLHFQDVHYFAIFILCPCLYFLCGFEGERCILLMKNLYAATFCPIGWFKLKWMAVSLHVGNQCMWICYVFFVW